MEATMRVRSVFARTVYLGRRGIAGWTAGIVAYTAFVIAFYPTVVDRPELRRQIEDYPTAFKELFGLRDILSAEGFLHAYLLSLLVPLLLVLYAVLTLSDATAGEESTHTLDMVLSQPVARSRFLLEKAAAAVTAMVVMATVAGLVVVAMGAAVDLHPPLGGLVAALASSVLLAAQIGAVALAVAAKTGNRGLARGVAAATAAGAYLLASLADLVDLPRWLRATSPFWQAVGSEPIRNGFDAPHLIALTIATAALAVVATRAFDRRDIPA
jgi:ABC-2 type transport system permease protein